MQSHKPTILVLASTFPRWKGDTEPRFVYDLCLHLKEKFTVIVLAPHSKGTQSTENMDGLSIIRYRYAPEKLETLAYEGGITAKLKSNKLNYLTLPFFFFGQWLAIIKILRQHPVKVIHAHWLIPQGFLALLARIFSSNKPTILCTSHGGDLYGLNDPISKVIKRYVIKNVEKMTVVSSAMQNEILKLVPEASLPSVAPMGTDLTNLFTPDDSVQREKYQLLFVGRLVEKKGLVYLLKALPEIISKFPEIQLRIAGSGPEQQILEKLAESLKIQQHIQFLGRLSHSELVTEYRKATLSVFPFIQANNGDIEGLGLVMIEAMGCGCPVVVSDIDAVQDVLIDNQTGVFILPKETKIITDKINNLLSDPEKRMQLAKQARKVVLEKFSWEESAKQYASSISRLI
ncbi:MAG: glycosyltransferase family 4 protein [Methylococcaceae bacterium]|nr:glycosyltransferase family 4 protein [Methylococcaceae bacterium]